VHWSPDGSWLVFNSARTGRFHIHKIKPDGTEDTPLTSGQHDNWSAEWTPDGKDIVFISNRDGNPEIYRMDANGKNLTRMTQTKESEGAPAMWSNILE
jgi:TolB protein